MQTRKEQYLEMNIGFIRLIRQIMMSRFTSDSPFGPFERVGKILQQDANIATGAGHHSVIKGPGADEWYIIYHRRPLGETAANSRATCIDRMYFDKGGKIKPVRMTFEGVEASPLSK
jgi:hypothetical protein